MHKNIMGNISMSGVALNKNKTSSTVNLIENSSIFGPPEYESISRIEEMEETLVEGAKCAACGIEADVDIDGLLASRLGWSQNFANVVKQVHDSIIQAPGTNRTFPVTPDVTILLVSSAPSPLPPLPPAMPPPSPPPLPPMMSPRSPNVSFVTPKILKSVKVTPKASALVTAEQLKSVKLRKVTDRPPMSISSKGTPAVTIDQLRSVKLRKRSSNQTITSPTRSPLSRDRLKKMARSPARRSRQTRPRLDTIPLSTILNFDLDMN